MIASFYTGHDSSVAVVGPGVLIHYERERRTRIKHDLGDKHTVDSLLEPIIDFGIDLEEIEAVIEIAPGETGMEWVIREDGDIYNWKKLGVIPLGGREIPHFIISHHAAHAAYAFYSSPYDAATILTLDGGGDMWFRGSDSDDVWASQPKIQSRGGVGHGSEEGVDLIFLPSHIGIDWTRTSEDLFCDGHAAGEVMALGGMSADGFTTMTGHCIETLDRVRDLQQRTNAEFLNSVHSGPVVLGGGVALNGIAAYELLRLYGDVWVPPAVNDAGLTIGACFAWWHDIERRYRLWFDSDEIAFCGKKFEVYGEPSVAEVAQSIVDENITFVAHGRAESGPRSLGHRAILSLPTADVRDRVNEMKFRQEWRPVAPVVPESVAMDHFDLINPDCFRFMTMIAPAKDPEAPWAHDDGTSRVQVVSDDSWLGRVCLQVGQSTGTPIIFNTSLNKKGEAMAGSAGSVVDSFNVMDGDTLFMGGGE